MPEKILTREELIALFEKKAAAPPPQSSRMFARHLQCRESLAVSRFLTEAMKRHAGAESNPLAVPSDLLPPLG
jgi:hypothetical protein